MIMKMFIPFYHTDYQLKNLKNINYDSKAAFELLNIKEPIIWLNWTRKQKQSGKWLPKDQITNWKIVNKSVDFSIGNTGESRRRLNQINGYIDHSSRISMEMIWMETITNRYLIHLIRVIEEDLKA